MMRHATRGLVLFGLLVAVVSTARAQTTPDTVEVRNRKDGTVKTYSGQFKVTPAGFQVFTGEKFDKPGEAFSPDDIVKVTVGDLPGIDAAALRAARDKEVKKTAKDYAEAFAGYDDLRKKAVTAPDRSKRYLAFKTVSLSQRLLDDLDAGKEWQDKADDVVGKWKDFLGDYGAKEKFGWEVWPAARSATRLQIERGKFDDAAQTWGRMKALADLPPEQKLDAAIQEIDLQIRSKAYPNAGGAADELLKTANGPRKERLTVYSLAAKAGSDSKHLDGVKAIEGELAKTKDATVQATAYGMMGELYLAGGKPRDAMWMFLWVETVMNQDKDEVFKAVTRLAEMFEGALADEEQAKKYREKLKRYRASF